MFAGVCVLLSSVLYTIPLFYVHIYDVLAMSQDILAPKKSSVNIY